MKLFKKLVGLGLEAVVITGLFSMIVISCCAKTQEEILKKK
ncbi:hypothetical protein [Mycoplasma sp. 1018B]|nr:hypothetical protein [Mycoplasma sp. 1018B]UUM19473.1 hypothetical protein NPA14_01235 [Mycoplasma sp. 1018B]